MTDKVLTANHLVLGETVYWAQHGWVFDLTEAMLVSDQQMLDQIDQKAGESELNNEVVSPYWIDVSVENGTIVPVHYREKYRSLGPSVRLDLGKQACLQDARAA